MKVTWRAVGIIGLAVAIACYGCGKDSKPQTPTPAATINVSLPEWAPKNPSPEFLRAAKVLKPIPPEILGSLGEKAGPAAQAVLARYHGTYPPAWEFFGTLSEQQIEHLRSSGTVRVPVKSMTPAQRHLLDRYFDAWRKAMAGQEQIPPDWLVVLYKEGAKEDLSNVEAGFVRDSSVPGVNMQFWITRSDGSVRTQSNTVAFM
jgi:hypothetical protein